MTHPQITYCSPDALKPRPNNPRTHTRRQVSQIADSIARFGFTIPVLVDQTNTIIAGHGRVMAAKLLNLTSIPVLRREDLSDADIRAYVIADNKLAERAGWDEALLAKEFAELELIAPDLDLTITGFERADIDFLISGLDSDGEEEPETAPPAIDRSRPPVSQLGDLWVIGPHRLLCADSTQAASYKQLLGEQKAQLVFTDPPYNVPVQGHVSGLGKAKHREFAMASGEMSSAEFEAFLTGVFQQLAAHSSDGAIHYICIDWRHVGEVERAGAGYYAEMKNICVWVKTNGGMGSLYRSQHEFVFVYKNGTASHVNNVELGKHGRYRTNVWRYAGVNSFGKTRDKDLADHPTVKPIAMVAAAIQDCSDRGAIVLDAFTGSGTTLLAAHKTGRHGYGLELDPRYVDVTLKRFQALNIEPVNAVTGESYTAAAAKPWQEVVNG
jgi:DNA modification methylase